MTGPEVIATWAELTGEKWQLLPCIVRDQACEFAAAGFSPEDMALVVKWTKREIARGGKHSMLWRVVAADNWQKFQERLTDARHAIGKGWRPAFKLSAEPAPFRAVPQPAPRPDPALFEQGAAAMAAWKAQRNGGAA